MTIDRGFNVFVVDAGNGNRVQEGHFSGYLTITWDKFIGDSHLGIPTGVATDALGNIYVVDKSSNNRYVVEYDSTGAFVKLIGNTLGTNKLNNPQGAAVDSAGNLYVADMSHNRIAKFNTTTGALTATITNASLANPSGIAVDSANNVYTTDTTDKTVFEFNSSGGLVRTFSVAATGVPYAVAVDSQGRIIVTDNKGGANGTIDVYSTTGGLLTTFSTNKFTGAYGDFTAGNAILVVGQTSKTLATLLQGPHLTSVASSSAVVGAGPTAIVLTGVNFANTSTVSIGGTPIPTTYTNTTTLKATIPSTSLTTAGVTTIAVTTPGNLGNTSSTKFTIKNPKPVGTITPSSAPIGSTNFAVEIDGIGFTPGTTVSIKGATIPVTVDSSTKLTATIPTADLTAAGNLVITLANPLGNGDSQLDFTVTNLVPSITGIGVSSAPKGSGNVTVPVTGSNFFTGSIVRLNGQKLATTYTDSGHLSAVIPSTMLTNVGSFPITVYNPGIPGDGISNSVTFMVTP